MARISTGSSQLDALLHGGFREHSINVLMGEPGTGKTLLAQQLAFANLGGERPVLYVSTLSEPLAKFLMHLQTFAFADSTRVGRDLIYHDLGEQLAHRPEALHDYLLELLQLHRPRIVIVDSFKAIADVMPDLVTWRKVLYETAGLLSAYDVTTFWVGEYTGAMLTHLPEFAVADGILELTRRQHGHHDERYLRIVKLRASGFAPGLHAFWLSGDGLRVFPRLVTPAEPLEYSPAPERLQTGIRGLDDMIASGWLRGSITLVAGPSGAGKTMLGLHFLRQGAEHGDPGLMVSFQENPVQLRRIMGSFGWDPEAMVQPGKIDIYYNSPVELQIDSIVGGIFERVERDGVRRIVIDALADLEASTDDPQRFRDYIYSLTQYLAARNVTTVLNLEAETPRVGGIMTGKHISYLADNVLFVEMQFDEDLTRMVRIAKSRGSAHDGRRHVLRIMPEGIQVE